MAVCRISVFSQYRFVSDTIYRSRTGVVTPRSCLIELSFIIIIILITKHPTWPRLLSPAQAVTVQNLASGGQMPGHGGMPTAPGGILRSKHRLNCLVRWKGQSWMAGCRGRISSYPSPGEIWWKKIVTFQFLQLVWISINALYLFFPPIPSMEFPQTIKFESRFHSTKSLYVITFKEWWGTQFKTL